MEIGFCPKCGAFVLEYRKLDYDGKCFIEYLKRKKALRLFDQLKNDITREVVTKVKHGNKSNMGFKYGENIEVNNQIKQYSVDFNGTKELIRH